MFDRHTLAAAACCRPASHRPAFWFDLERLLMSMFTRYDRELGTPLSPEQLREAVRKTGKHLPHFDARQPLRWHMLLGQERRRPARITDDSSRRLVSSCLLLTTPARRMLWNVARYSSPVQF